MLPNSVSVSVKIALKCVLLCSFTFSEVLCFSSASGLCGICNLPLSATDQANLFSLSEMSPLIIVSPREKLEEGTSGQVR